jgi:hypothetical protein
MGCHYADRFSYYFAFLKMFLFQNKTIVYYRGGAGNAQHCWMAGVRFPAGTKPFLYSIAFRPAMGHLQPPIQWVPGVF